MSSLPRRTFVLGSIAGVLGVRVPAVAQATRTLPRIGYLAFNSAVVGRDVQLAFLKGMGELGWIDGKNVTVEVRFADGQVDRLPGLVDELLRNKADVLVAGSSAVTRAAKAATSTVPIVMLASADAVGEGFVASLARPGGNVTGMTLLAGPEIASKQLELLREIVPAATRVAVLTNPRNGSHTAFSAELKTVARRFGTQLQSVRAESPDQLDRAFASMANERAMAVLVLSDAMFWGERRRIAELARRGGLPGMYSQREYVDAGGLVSYGPSLVDMSRRAAKQVDKILRGARPSSVPVEQPTKFDLVVNTKTARELGITVPQSLLLRAEEVID